MLEQITPPAGLPIDSFTMAEHLHLATSAPELDETPTLERLIGAAAAAIEQRTETALIMRTLRGRFEHWPIAFPIAPVAAIEKVEIVDAQGVSVQWDGWFLVQGARQRIGTRKGQIRPTIPAGGYVDVTFTAGYGTGWTDIPPDLRHAVALLAAHYYEHREASANPLAPIPFGVGSLIAPYRPIRL